MGFKGSGFFKGNPKNTKKVVVSDLRRGEGGGGKRRKAEEGDILRRCFGISRLSVGGNMSSVAWALFAAPRKKLL
jgi:hypothetical protein